MALDPDADLTYTDDVLDYENEREAARQRRQARKVANPFDDDVGDGADEATRGGDLDTSGDIGAERNLARSIDETVHDEIPKLMGAAVYRTYGTPEVALRYVAEYPSPKLTHSGQVLIRVHASAVNPLDARMMAGTHVLPILKRLPFIPGFDVCGQVVQAGLDCKRIRKGDFVWALTDHSRCGGMAQYVVLTEKEVALKPKNVGFAEAASLPLVATTAYKAMVMSASVSKDEKVLILGGSGGVGTVAIQLAKALGAHVTCTTSARNVDLVSSLGADYVIDYNAANWWEVLSGKDFDVILDTVGGYDTWERSEAVLRPKGKFITTTGDNAQGAEGLKGFLASSASTVNRKFWSLLGGNKYDQVSASSSYEALDAIRSLVEAGQVVPVIDRLYRLDDVKEAFEHSGGGHARGKVVVSIIPDVDPPRQLSADIDALDAYQDDFDEAAQGGVEL